MRKLMFMLAACVAFAACGGDEKAPEKTFLAPETTEIKGDLKDYFTVVDKEYTLTDADYFGKMVTITLKRTDKALPARFDGFEPVGTYGAGVRGNYGVGIVVKNANDEEVMNVRADHGGMGGVYSHEDLLNLWELEAGEEANVRWSTSDLDKCTGKMTFRITSYAK